MKKLNAILIMSAVAASLAGAQTAPPLTVIVVIDQLPIFLVERNLDLFSEGGFARLEQEGMFMTECRYRHGVLETGPGHATIATGCDPKSHGIVGNGWREEDGRRTYCAGCDDAHPVKSDGTIDLNSSSGCPKNLTTEGLSDIWKDKFGDTAKVWSLSIKDRAAILMGGKNPDGVLWADRNLEFETSTYYANAIPDWCRNYNKGLAQFGGRTWERSAPTKVFTRTDPDDSAYERGDQLGLENTLPKTLPDFDADDPRKLGTAIYGTPFGNDWLYGMLTACIEHEALGQDNIPDLLWVSFSSNDVCGHAFGPFSQEILDMTIRTDKLIGDLLDYLDSSVGLYGYWFALTSDHGVCPPFESPQVEKGIGGRFSFGKMKADLNQHLKDSFGIEAHSSGDLVSELGLPIVSMNTQVVTESHLDLRETAQVAINWLRKQNGVADAVLTVSLEDVSVIEDSTLRAHISNNYFPGRFGDAYLHPLPYWQSDGTCSNHGSIHDYDIHVPTYLFGGPFTGGRSRVDCGPEDIAPTIAAAAGLVWRLPRDGSNLVTK